MNSIAVLNRPARLTWGWLAMNGSKSPIEESDKKETVDSARVITSDCNIITADSVNIIVKSGVTCNIYKVFGEVNIDDSQLSAPGVLNEEGESDRQNLSRASQAHPKPYIIDSNKITIEEAATVTLTHVIANNDSTYIDVNVEMTGRKASFSARNAYMLKGAEYLDMNYTVRERAPKCVCNIKSQGSLFDESRKIYRATIDFVKGCTGSKGLETEDVLLLSPAAINRSLPILLCTCEDVEGVHGATIGRLNRDQLYYLTSRGLNEIDAQVIIAKERLLSVLRSVPQEDSL